MTMQGPDVLRPRDVRDHFNTSTDICERPRATQMADKRHSE